MSDKHVADVAKAHALVRESFPSYLSAVLLFDPTSKECRTAANVKNAENMALILRNEADRIEALTMGLPLEVWMKVWMPVSPASKEAIDK